MPPARRGRRPALRWAGATRVVRHARPTQGLTREILPRGAAGRPRAGGPRTGAGGGSCTPARAGRARGGSVIVERQCCQRAGWAACMGRRLAGADSVANAPCARHKCDSAAEAVAARGRPSRAATARVEGHRRKGRGPLHTLIKAGRASYLDAGQGTAARQARGRGSRPQGRAPCPPRAAAAGRHRRAPCRPRPRCRAARHSAARHAPVVNSSSTSSSSSPPAAPRKLRPERRPRWRGRRTARPARAAGAELLGRRHARHCCQRRRRSRRARRRVRPWAHRRAR